MCTCFITFIDSPQTSSWIESTFLYIRKVIGLLANHIVVSAQNYTPEVKQTTALRLAARCYSRIQSACGSSEAPTPETFADTRLCLGATLLFAADDEIVRALVAAEKLEGRGSNSTAELVS